jgi:hypothetical protein
MIAAVFLNIAVSLRRIAAVLNNVVPEMVKVPPQFTILRLYWKLSGH